MSQITPTDEQRRIIYQARRGLKELDFYIDPYVKNYYLQADANEQASFAKLLSYEDPDLLNFFLNQDRPQDTQVLALIDKMKAMRHHNVNNSNNNDDNASGSNDDYSSNNDSTN